MSWVFPEEGLKRRRPRRRKSEKDPEDKVYDDVHSAINPSQEQTDEFYDAGGFDAVREAQEESRKNRKERV
jgi:hypothetical protein